MQYAWSIHDNFAAIAAAITPVIVIASQIAITVQIHQDWGEITMKIVLPGFRKNGPYGSFYNWPLRLQDLDTFRLYMKLDFMQKVSNIKYGDLNIKSNLIRY